MPNQARLFTRGIVMFGIQGCSFLSFLLFFAPRVLFAEGIKDFNLPFGHKVLSSKIEGSITVNRDLSTHSIKITKDFYGADAHGFSVLPSAPLVVPLRPGLVKLGGSLHATYNWEFNAYHDKKEIQIGYAPLISRLNYIEKNYMAHSMFEVNMLGLQPDRDPNGALVFEKTADAEHAARAITYINGTNKMGLKHIMMGNEPFETEEYHEIEIPTADEYIDKYIDYAMKLRAAQEKVSGNPNDIKLWGPELNTGWTGWQTNNLPDCMFDYDLPEKIKCSYGNGRFRDFVPYFLSRLADFEKDSLRNPKKYKMLDYLTIHYYPLFRTNFSDPESIIKDPQGNQLIAGMLESVNLWDNPAYINYYDAASPKRLAPNIIKKFKSWTRQYYPDVLMGVTEFGIDSMDKIKYHPIVRPLYLADFVARVATAGLDTLINSFLQGGRVSNSWAMIDRNNKTSIYYMYSLFTNYFLGDIVSTADTFDDYINSYAVKTNKGTNVFIVNKDVIKHAAGLQFKSMERSQQVLELEVPPWSLTVLLVPDNQKAEITVHQYGALEIGANLTR